MGDRLAQLHHPPHQLRVRCAAEALVPSADHTAAERERGARPELIPQRGDVVPPPALVHRIAIRIDARPQHGVIALDAVERLERLVALQAAHPRRHHTRIAERIGQHLQRPRLERIIRIELEHDLARCKREAAVPVRGHAEIAVVLLDANAVEGAKDLQRAIRARVIDSHDLPIAERLRANTLHRGSDILFCVERRDEDGEARRHVGIVGCRVGRLSGCQVGPDNLITRQPANLTTRQPHSATQQPSNRLRYPSPA